VESFYSDTRHRRAFRIHDGKSTGGDPSGRFGTRVRQADDAYALRALVPSLRLFAWCFLIYLPNENLMRFYERLSLKQIFGNIKTF